MGAKLGRVLVKLGFSLHEVPGVGRVYRLSDGVSP